MKEHIKYHSSSGLATRKWGPSGWNFLFSCIMGSYPPKLNLMDKQHQQLRKQFKIMLLSLRYTMPCIFCRESFQSFVKDLPINPFLIGRIELMYWLYLIRDKVNKKLIAQEKKCYTDEKKRLYKLLKQGKLTKEDFKSQLVKFKRETFITTSSPPFYYVLDKYESFRAVCSKKAKTCSLPKRKLH